MCFIGLIRWQVASEKAELLKAVTEYEKEIGHLASLYNDHKALLDQLSLGTDLVELAGYASPYFPVVLVVLIHDL